MSTSQGGQGISASDTYHCKPCRLSFKTEKAFKLHKIRSGRHVCCDVCGIDFKNEDAKKAHRTAVHAAEQDLECPYCHLHFNRLGGLVSHWELTKCRVLPKEVFDKARQEISDHQEAIRLAHSFNDYSRSGTTRGASEPLPPIGRSVSGSNGYTNAQAPLISFGDKNTTSTVIGQDEDLISFDEQSAILNAPWGLPVAKVLDQAVPKFNPDKDFPPLTNTGNFVSSYPVNQAPVNKAIITNQAKVAPAATSRGNVWGGPAKVLFPHAPPAVAPPAELLNGLTITPLTPAPIKVYDEFDPENPKFVVSKFFNIYTKKFKCPHNGCGKSHATDNSFIAHLKSPAHRNEKLQCTKCLRYFDTATALTQHSESQGVRCNVRNTDNYGSVVIGVTANTAIPVGRWEDDTIKYGINPEAGSMGVTTIVEAHRAAHKAKNDEFNNYWNGRQAKW